MQLQRPTQLLSRESVFQNGFQFEEGAISASSVYMLVPWSPPKSGAGFNIWSRRCVTIAVKISMLFSKFFDLI